MFGAVATGTPNLGFGLSDVVVRVVRIARRPGPGVAGGPGPEAGFAATRMEPANDTQAVHGAPPGWTCQLMKVCSPSLRPRHFGFTFASN